ncbi:hypothetical protein BON30_33360 [Cystobacter ferrugineus]|uniref:Uncharacterized protein n=2 Tax=Cystobacter ferrugineus TaxID=83449 RepID=A0A1L9B2Z5_9BACT|nr:hypothetical protein BON30_33360 [Cystobacter ferrugineus]
MGSTKHPWRRFGAPLAFLVGTLPMGSFARAQDEAPTTASPSAEAPAAERPDALQPAPPPVEETITHCGNKDVGPLEGQLQPLGHGFYADGTRVRRGCTLLLQRPLKDRPAIPFAPDSFKPLGCGFFRYATSIYWHKPLAAGDTDEEPGGERGEVLTRLDLADAETFEVGETCRPRDARFFYLNHTDRPALPDFIAVPRDEGAGYEELGCGFVRYAGRVFFGTRSLDGVHAPSFTSVQGRLPAAECGEGMYGKDRAHVWWQHEQLRGASAKVFRVPREDNPDLRVGCSGKRSFVLAEAQKKPHPVCRGAKKPAKVKLVKKNK